MTSLAEPVRESLSISEFFRVTGFFRSFRLCPGLDGLGDHCMTLYFSLVYLMLPSFSSASSTEMIGTLVTYFPSTSSES